MYFSEAHKNPGLRETRVAGFQSILSPSPAKTTYLASKV